MTVDSSGSKDKWINDIDYGGLLCTDCKTLIISDSDEADCPECGSHNIRRKKNSLSRTWALTLASLFLYIPANILPIMDVQIMGQSSKSTILGGVIELFNYEMYFICIVVFVASFVVPVFKIGSLIYLLITVNRKSLLNNKQKTKLFSLVELIGKWSMLDVYVVAVMAGLINIGFLLKTTGGYGLIFFASVVVLTMLASHSFDTRLIWDEG